MLSHGRKPLEVSWSHFNNLRPGYSSDFAKRPQQAVVHLDRVLFTQHVLPRPHQSQNGGLNPVSPLNSHLLNFSFSQSKHVRSSFNDLAAATKMKSGRTIAYLVPCGKLARYELPLYPCLSLQSLSSLSEQQA